VTMTIAGRIVLAVLALLLIAVPVWLLLVNYGVLDGGLVLDPLRSQVVQPVANVTTADFTTSVRIIIALAGFAVALAGALWLLAIVRTGHFGVSDAVVEDEPGSETLLRPRAVRRLAEAAAMEAGAEEASVSLSENEGAFDVVLDLTAPRASVDLRTHAQVARSRVQEDLADQGVRTGSVEVVITDSAASARVR
jgi:hypothetical protein